MWRTVCRHYRVVPTPLHDFLRANSSTAKADSAALHSSTSLVVADTNSDSIYENLAAEEALLRGLALGKEQCLLLFYVNKPCVVVGRNQNIFQEVSLRRAASDGVDVARRASGGGAVFHDAHNLCFSFLTHRSRYAPERTIQLVRLGLGVAYGVDPARLTSTSRSDLFLDGKKVTGSAMRVQRDVAYHHCTLLVNTPHALLARYLHPEGRYLDFRTSSVGSVRSPVTTLTEAHCVADGADAMAEMKRNMAAFFLAHGQQILAHSAPWDMDINDLRLDFATSRQATDTHPMFLLDVRGAVADAMPFVEGEGRRYARGDAVTMAEAVRRAQSVAWAYAMPTFTTVVQLTREEFTRRLCGLPAWADVVRLSSLTSAELLEELAAVLFPASGDNGNCGDALRLHTTVDHRSITHIVVTATHAVDETGVKGAAVAVEETAVEWLSRYLSTLLVGYPCDVAVDGVEAPGNSEVLTRGFVHESGALAPDLPDLAHDAAVLMTVKVLLSVWRDKNVFDVHRVTSD